MPLLFRILNLINHIMATRVAFNADDKIINQNNDTQQIDVQNLDNYFEVEYTSEVILQKDYSIIALQFPDELMSYASYVSTSLENRTKKKVYILADTSYGSCCVDEVAANHYNADFIIHYGQTCLSYPEKTPVFFVFGQGKFDTECFISTVKNAFSNDENILLFYDVQYTSAVNNCREVLGKNFSSIVVSTIITNKAQDSSNDSLTRKFGRIYELKYPLESYKILFIGNDGRTLYNFMISYNRNEVYSYSPSIKVLRKEDMNVNKYLMKRYYLIEKAKDAEIVGIMMGTLGVARYKEMVSRLKKVLKLAGKKCYTFVVGKVNPAKLANFMEIDIFVLVACPENSLIDSKEFYKPIVTPYEMEIACLKSRTWTGDYVTDFRDLLPGCSFHVEFDEKNTNEEDEEPEYSFITGKFRKNHTKLDTNEEQCSNKIAVRNQETTVSNIHPTSATEYLSSRMWQGLQIDSGKTEVKKVVPGRSGIAMNYSNESA